MNYYKKSSAIKKTDDKIVTPDIALQLNCEIIFNHSKQTEHVKKYDHILTYMEIILYCGNYISVI